ncbi:hypothetical protein C4D60_Mb04t11170 [Musa balbisiana]|uniref:Uncharacterized protein n=1 Tax=Musa balbisiana TaxID=52838 RepID=A0A4S8KB71_MUSBA|nr:hypothetical protein C4D60_Mb04t11170 [Musa balbisiana]
MNDDDRGCSPRPVLTHFGETQQVIPDGHSSLVGVQLGGYWWVPHLVLCPLFPPRSRQLDRSIWQRRGANDRVIESQRRPSLSVYHNPENNFADERAPPKLDNIRKVSVIPLVFLIFYEVSGGPFGIEDSVQAAGPLLAILGFLIFPFIWSIPEALITAEMGTMFPENGGYVVWVSSALGPFWGFQQGTGGIPLDRELWTDGYFSDVAKILAGVWLRWWVQGASALSNMGMFVAEMSSDSYQLLGMAERGMLPEFFGKRSRYGTPLVGILFSASGVLLLSWMSFQEIVAAENFLYCFGMILEFVAFIKLRLIYPNAPRPYKIPLGTAGCILMIIPPTILICVVLALATLKVMVVSVIAMLIGFILQPCLKHVEKKRLLKFSVNSDLPDFREAQHENTAESSLID